MATHARGGIGHAGGSRFFDRDVAIAAINSQLLCMMSMAEGDWLVQRHIDARRVRRPKDRVPPPSCEADEKTEARQTRPGNRIRPPSKQLRHGLSSKFPGTANN